VESLIGYLAALLTTISFLPQVLRVVITRRTRDISKNMYIALCTGIFLWLIYGFMKNDLPIILANAVTFFLALTILIFKLTGNDRE